ncbi:MAG: dual specificity protein phosphatase family protein [Promethearchaeota archaeon]
MFKDIGITAIVNLMEENLYDPTPLGYYYLHKGFADDTYPPHEYLDEILNFIDLHLNKNGKVLVHCSMGVSRSGGVAIAWLLKKNPNWSWEDALSYIKKSKFIAPAMEIKHSVLDYIEKLEDRKRKN